MSRWLQLALIVLVVWAVLAIGLGLLEFAVELAGALALPIALFVGYLAYRRLK